MQALATTIRAYERQRQALARARERVAQAAYDVVYQTALLNGIEPDEAHKQASDEYYRYLDTKEH